MSESKIIYFDEPIKIKFINSNEESLEHVFKLDNKNNLINNFTFTREISILDIISFKNKLINSDTIHLDNCFLLYSFYYQISFCHFMTNTIPKLYDYIINFKNYTLLIPKVFYNNLCKDIIERLNININNIYLLEDNKIYNIKNLITINHYEAPPSPYSLHHIYTYNLLRKSLNIVEFDNKYRNIYLKRDGVSNKLFGNSETGLLRQIINENELIKFLQKKNFEIVTLGNKHLIDKYNCLKQANIIITPLGANCLNLIFSDCPKNLIVLSNSENFGYEYYVNLLQLLSNKKTNHKLLNFKSIYNNDKSNQWNSSYYVDIKILELILNTMQ